MSCVEVWELCELRCCIDTIVRSRLLWHCGIGQSEKAKRGKDQLWRKELLSIVTHFNLAHFTLKALGLRSRHCFIDLCLSSSLESCKGNRFLDWLEIKTKISWAVWVLRNVILIGESELIVSTYFFSTYVVHASSAVAVVAEFTWIQLLVTSFDLQIL